MITAAIGTYYLTHLPKLSYILEQVVTTEFRSINRNYGTEYLQRKMILENVLLVCALPDFRIRRRSLPVGVVKSDQFAG